MRSAIPGWDASPAAFEMILLEQFAYVGDILNFYIDRLAAEAYIQSAVLRESVLNLAYAFGYVPTAQSAASGTITFKKVTDDPITVPKGTQFYANAADTQVIFETTGDVYDSGLTDTVVALPAREGVTVTEESLGMSSGGERMTSRCTSSTSSEDSIEVSVAEGGIDSATGSPALISWEQIPRMIEADAADRVFSVYVNEVGVSIVRFGDGTTGRIPPTGAAIYATYRYGKGVLGNVAAGAIKSIVTGGAIAGQLKEITNPSPFAGGADAEPLESMRTNVPRSLRALDRAVTLQDFADLAIQVAGIAKAGAGAVLNTGVTLAVVGYDYSNVVADQTTLTSLTNFMNERKTIGTTLTIVGPTYKFVNVTGSDQSSTLCTSGPRSRLTSRRRSPTPTPSRSPTSARTCRSATSSPSCRRGARRRYRGDQRLLSAGRRRWRSTRTSRSPTTSSPSPARSSCRRQAASSDGRAPLARSTTPYRAVGAAPVLTRLRHLHRGHRPADLPHPLGGWSRHQPAVLDQDPTGCCRRGAAAVWLGWCPRW